MNDKLNPRYELYLTINPKPKNWEYVLWIAQMASSYRKKIGVDRYSSVAFDPMFDLYLNDEVKKINNLTAATGMKVTS